jgi:hypothetical protein
MNGHYNITRGEERGLGAGVEAWAAAILKIRGIQLWQLYDQLFVYDQLFGCHFVSKL